MTDIHLRGSRLLGADRLQTRATCREGKSLGECWNPASPRWSTWCENKATAQLQQSPPLLLFVLLLYLKKKNKPVMTVPGLAPFRDLINTNPQQAPLPPAHRGHIHPKVGTTRRARGGGGTGDTHFYLKEFFCHSITAVLKA